MDQKLAHCFKRLAASNDFDEVMNYRIAEELAVLLTTAPSSTDALRTILTRYQVLSELVDYVREHARAATAGTQVSRNAS